MASGLVGRCSVRWDVCAIWTSGCGGVKFISYISSGASVSVIAVIKVGCLAYAAGCKSYIRTSLHVL